MNQQLILVTGVTGYVGGRLVPRLLASGYKVRCLVRDPSRLKGRPWFNQVEIVAGDFLDPESLITPMLGISTIYYLVHSLSGGNNFSKIDIQAARNCAKIAKSQRVGHIIYLGGLGDPETALSVHLASRHETGEALKSEGAKVTEFRAAVIVGSGSLSFEMVRYLTERLPIMICPKWVYTRIQPIAIRNVLEYLVAALENPNSMGKIIEIGGKDVITYAGMMRGFAKVRGLKRYLVAVPVLTPRLSSYWVHFVTPISREIAQPLIKGLGNEVVVRNTLAAQLFPQIELLGYESAVRLALDKIEAHDIETMWTDALISSQLEKNPVTLMSREGMIIERRRRQVTASSDKIFSILMRIGGKRGWMYMDWAWQLRGRLDRLVGGVGMRRGKRDPDQLRVGESLDFWRVEQVEDNRLLRLRAEMKVPGKAWLEFEIREESPGNSILLQTAFFEPKGLLGLLYWYSIYPIHALIFSGLVQSISQAAERVQEKVPNVSEFH